MNALIIANTQIRRDVAGRYCLNDLHQASGAEQRKQPRYWLANQQTQDLVTELACGDLENSGNPLVSAVAVTEGRAGGTYAVKELVYAYAMWISAKFHLHVIRAYDVMVTGQGTETVPAVPTSAQHRADVIVAASRGFTALVRAGRCIGLDRQRSVHAANAATLRATGIDLVTELDAGDVLDAPAPAGAVANLTDQVQLTIAPWLDERTETTTEEVIASALNANPESRELQTRVGIALRHLGWRQQRHNRGGAGRVRVWHAPTVRWGVGQSG
jgi:hypothetical protein